MGAPFRDRGLGFRALGVTFLPFFFGLALTVRSEPPTAPIPATREAPVRVRAAKEPARTSAVCIPGEEHIYEVRWGVIPLGILRARTDNRLPFGEASAYRVAVYADSHPWLIFLTLHELYESWIDADEVFCRKEIAHLEIGAEQSLETYDFRYGPRKLHYLLEPVGKEREEGDVDLPGRSQDIVSFAFFLRAMAHAKPPWEATVSTLVHAEMKPTFLRCNGTREEIVIGEKHYRALRIDGEARYKTPEGFSGRFVVWVADDATRLPLRAQMKIFVGWITVELATLAPTR